jgi:hypothetical protein
MSNFPEFKSEREIHDFGSAPIIEINDGMLLALLGLGLGQMLGDEGLDTVFEITIATVDGSEVRAYAPIELLSEFIATCQDAQETYRKMLNPNE